MGGVDDADKEAIRMRAVKMVVSAGGSPEKVAHLISYPTFQFATE